MKHQHNCHCPHHLQSTVKHHSIPKVQQLHNIDYVIKLMQNNFISPLKILLMIDAKQADYFKIRNKSQGCCTSNQITIKDSELTKTQLYLKEYMEYSYLKLNIDKILSYSYERFNNIVENGKKDKLDVTEDVEKYIINKVLMESVNHYIFLQLSDKIKQESLRFNKQIGLWATPATWIQKYPKDPLNFLDSRAISQLVNNGWSTMPKFYVKSEQLHKQLLLLEKDGKFEQFTTQNVDMKILNNPQSYGDVKNSRNQLLFTNLREMSKRISSIPFQLNSKVNLYCTISPNLHILYTNKQIKIQQQRKQLSFSVLLPIGSSVTLQLNNQQINLDQGTLFLIENKQSYKINFNNNKQLFIVRNYIGSVYKK